MKAVAVLLIAALALASVADVAADSKTFNDNNSSSKCKNKAPAPPKDLKAGVLSPTSVRLTWKAKDDSCVDFYEVSVSTTAFAGRRFAVERGRWRGGGGRAGGRGGGVRSGAGAL